MLTTVPNAPTETGECSCCTAATYRWRGQRVMYSALALALVCLCAGYGAALAAGRRLGQ